MQYIIPTILYIDTWSAPSPQKRKHLRRTWPTHSLFSIFSHPKHRPLICFLIMFFHFLYIMNCSFHLLRLCILLLIFSSSLISTSFIFHLHYHKLSLSFIHCFASLLCISWCKCLSRLVHFLSFSIVHICLINFPFASFLFPSHHHMNYFTSSVFH